jgi:hypothetical protein
MADAGAPTDAITLDYASPPEDLRPFLSIFYEFRANVAFFEDTDKADLAQFRFMLSGEGEYRFADGRVQRAPAIQIVGPTTGPTCGRLVGPVHVFGVGLLPAGWANLLDFEASLLVNRVIDATELFGNGLRATAIALKSATTIEEKVAISSAVARELTKQGKAAAFDFTRLVDDWLDSSASPGYRQPDRLERRVATTNRTALQSLLWITAQAPVAQIPRAQGDHCPGSRQDPGRCVARRRLLRPVTFHP